jgi:hypothetical protein
LQDVFGIKPLILQRLIAKALDSKVLLRSVADDLDAIRVIGNLAAHSEKDPTTVQIIDLEPHEAEWLLSTLEALFEFYYIDRPKEAARRAADPGG